MFKKVTKVLVTGSLILTVAGCGTLLKPERIGKTATKNIDPMILALDCCGLLFGVIPGVVALVIDVNNNTIYFSASEVGAVSHDINNMTAVKLNDMSEKSIETALTDALGKDVKYSEICFAVR